MMKLEPLAVRVARRFRAEGIYRTVLEPQRVITYVERGEIGIADIAKVVVDEFGPLEDMRFMPGLSDAATTTMVPWYGFDRQRALVRGRLVLRVELGQHEVRRPIEVIVDRADNANLPRRGA